jgi:zinc protease
MKHTVTEVKLSNGVQGLLVHIPDASVMTIDINFRAGEFLVSPKKWEVPHIMEHLLLGANELIPKAREFQAELEKNGAYSNASTGVYDITYETECADFEWDRVLGLLLVAITKPLFLEDEFKAEFGNVQEEIIGRANNHHRQLSQHMRRALGLIVRTDAERLKLMPNVELPDIVAHYQRTHTAPNLRFVIAGNISAKRRTAIEQLFASIDLPGKGQRFVLPKETPKQVDKAVYVPNSTVENLYFFIDTFAKRRLSDDETDALNLMNTMLTETLYSKIFGTARERGLVYGMSSGQTQTRDVSNWWLGAQVSDRNASALFKIVVDELGKVMAGDIDEREIAATKLYSLGRFQRSAQTVGGTAGGYSGRYFFDGDIENYFKIPERIQAVTKERMVTAAQALFADGLWDLGVLGSCGQEFADDLRQQVAPLWAQR